MKLRCWQFLCNLSDEENILNPGCKGWQSIKVLQFLAAQVPVDFTPVSGCPPSLHPPIHLNWFSMQETKVLLITYTTTIIVFSGTNLPTVSRSNSSSSSSVFPMSFHSQIFFDRSPPQTGKFCRVEFCGANMENHPERLCDQRSHGSSGGGTGSILIDVDTVCHTHRKG